MPTRGASSRRRGWTWVEKVQPVLACVQIPVQYMHTAACTCTPPVQPRREGGGGPQAFLTAAGHALSNAPADAGPHPAALGERPGCSGRRCAAGAAASAPAADGRAYSCRREQRACWGGAPRRAAAHALAGAGAGGRPEAAQLADVPGRILQAHRLAARQVVRVRSDGVRLSARGPRAQLCGVRHRPPRAARLLWLRHLLRDEHHRHRRQDHPAHALQPPPGDARGARGRSERRRGAGRRGGDRGGAPRDGQARAGRAPRGAAGPRHRRRRRVRRAADHGRRVRRAEPLPRADERLRGGVFRRPGGAQRAAARRDHARVGLRARDHRVHRDHPRERLLLRGQRLGLLRHGRLHLRQGHALRQARPVKGAGGAGAAGGVDGGQEQRRAARGG